ncbi:trehalase-like domain-containing protein [Cupriavidus sp. SK-3]|uniref:trehalase-like domain-containing protein n=1 Tax=Cupriavidus sp. SK-3 TaxID=1470558 RepID=UPI0012698009|nr:trehalase-like domain-containing protein [Cupriavidus sp. SK-3]
MFRNPRYPPIADYAVIGNTHSVALVSTSGSIEWCCMRHFDDGAAFCRLLDANRGGYYQVRPTGRAISSRYYRVPGGVLETLFEASGGIIRLTDFMHGDRLARSRLDHDSPECHRLLWRIDAIVGEVKVELVFSPSFDNAHKLHQWEVGSHGWHRADIHAPIVWHHSAVSGHRSFDRCARNCCRCVHARRGRKAAALNQCRLWRLADRRTVGAQRRKFRGGGIWGRRRACVDRIEPAARLAQLGALW